MTKYKNFYFKWNTNKTKARVFIYYLHCHAVAVGSFVCTDVWTNVWRVMFSSYFRKVKKIIVFGRIVGCRNVLERSRLQRKSLKKGCSQTRPYRLWIWVRFFFSFFRYFFPADSVRRIQACGQTMWNIPSRTSVHVGTYRLVQKLRTTNIFCVLSPFIHT